MHSNNISCCLTLSPCLANEQRVEGTGQKMQKA